MDRPATTPLGGHGSGDGGGAGLATSFDAVVVGAGPNGLAAAVRIARSGRSVLVVEGHESPGGGARTAGLTLPGFRHDVCSAVHPMGLASPFFRELSLERHGLEWVHPPLPLAHPLDGGEAVALERSVEATAAQFSPASERVYRTFFGTLAKAGPEFFDDLLLAPTRFPRHPMAMALFGAGAFPSALDAARVCFDDERARALYAGNAAHSVLPLDRVLSTGAIGLALMLAAHVHGWPLAKGGSQAVADALVVELKSHGGRIATSWRVRTLEELPPAGAYFFDTSPRALVEIAGRRLPDRYRRQLLRFRHGPGVFKLDYALSEPIPWIAAACRRAGTVHLGGGLDEITRSEYEAWQGIHSERPFVLASQPSLFDPTRAPEGQHTFWAYCHVPTGSDTDMTDAVERQIERFAPGFRDCVLARHAMRCADYERYNPNLVGGDIVGGVTDWRQLITRPTVSLRPHATPAPDLFLCSASTPPGGGVHGMCGWRAAEAWLSRQAGGHDPH